MHRLIASLVAALVTAPFVAPLTASAAPIGSTVDGEAPSIESTRATIVALIAALGDGQGPVTTRACKTNAEGQCIYRERDRKRIVRPAPPTADQQALIAAYEAFLADPAGAAAAEADAYRYHLARLLDETGDLQGARVHLAALTAGSDADPRTIWATLLLIDGLVREWTDPEVDDAARQAAGRRLRAELTRAQGRALARAPEAMELRMAGPRLEAGVRWTQAMDLVTRGREATNPDAAAAAFTACAREFRAIFADFPTHPEAARLLWYTGQCLDAAYATDAALAQWIALVDAFPNSEYVQQTIVLIADRYVSLARFEEAATWCERFVARYPRDVNATQCFERAFWIRRELGPRDRLEATYAAYEGLYARRDPAAATRIRWAAYPTLITGDRARRTFLEALLAARGWQSYEPILRRVAAVELASVLLRETCPKGQILGGLCMRIDEAPRTRRRRWVVARRGGVDQVQALGLAASPRDPEWRRKAERQLDGDPSRSPELREAIAVAALIQADAGFEALIVGKAQPRPLDAIRLSADELPGPASAEASQPASTGLSPSLAGVAALSGPRAEDVDGLDRAYAAIDELAPASVAAVRARARRGLLRDWLTDEAASSMVASERSPVAALEAEALAAYRYCLAPTAAALAADESVAHCERRVVALAPGDPAILPEFFRPIDAAGYGHPTGRPDVVGVILDVDKALSIGARLTSGSKDTSDE